MSDYSIGVDLGGHEPQGLQLAGRQYPDKISAARTIRGRDAVISTS